MSDEMKTLQLFYAAALADAAYHYGQHRIFDKVTQEKRQRQSAMAGAQLESLGIATLREAYEVYERIFGCARWEIEETDSSLVATCRTCMLCGIARKQGSPQPCRPFCINPFQAFATELGYELDVQETLWDGERCRFVNGRAPTTER